MTMKIVFFNDTATTEIYTLSLHDALPICSYVVAGVNPTYSTDVVLDGGRVVRSTDRARSPDEAQLNADLPDRSEEHTSELQSRLHTACRLLLEKIKPVACTSTSTRPERPI